MRRILQVMQIVPCSSLSRYKNIPNSSLCGHREKWVCFAVAKPIFQRLAKISGVMDDRLSLADKAKIARLSSNNGYTSESTWLERPSPQTSSEATCTWAISRSKKSASSSVTRRLSFYRQIEDTNRSPQATPGLSSETRPTAAIDAEIKVSSISAKLLEFGSHSESEVISMWGQVSHSSSVGLWLENPEMTP